MRFLLVQSAPYVPALGGANKHNRALLEFLAARGHDCAVVALASPEVPALSFERAGVSVDAVVDGSRLRDHLVRRIAAFAPDRVLVSSEDPAQALLEAALEASPGRVVYLAHTTLGLPCGPQAFLPSEKRTALLRRTAAVLAASRYVAGYLHRWAGVEAAVLPLHFYPTPSPVLGRSDAGYVTLVNPCAVKGLPIFLELARLLPEMQFAAVPTWGTTAADRVALASLGNVTLLSPSEEIGEIFARTRVLLVPSLWAEAFGAICVEAMLAGIPVLASDVGGLPEAMLGVPDLLPVQPIERYAERLDDRGIPVPEIPPQDAGPWLLALGQLLADRALYERRSAAVRAAASAYVAALDHRRTEAFLSGLAGLAPAGGTAVEPSRPAAGTGTDDELRRRLDRISPGKLELLKRRLQKSAGAAADLAPITAIPRQPRQGAGDAFPLSFAQQRLWFLHRLDPESASYNEYLFARLTGSLRPAALAAALDGLTARHELLRTRYVEAEGEPRQVVDPPGRRPLPVVCLRALPEGVRQAEMERLARRVARWPLDLERGPVLCSVLLRLGEDEHVLAVVVHHIAADHWAITVALSELSALYAAAVAGRPADLPPLPIQYADYAVHERRQLSGPVLQGFLDAWRRELAGAPAVLDLPGDRPRPAVQTFRGARARLALTPALTAALKERARQEGATLYMLLLAGLLALFHRLTGREDLVVGTPVAGRNRVETERLVGYFLNVLPLRGRPGGDLPFRALLAQVRQTTLDAFARQELPFEKLVLELAPERSLSYSPLFQVLLNLQNVPRPSAKLADLDLTPLPIEIGIAKFDLDLYLEEGEGGLLGSVFYSTDLFDAPTVERLLARLGAVLAHAAARPEDPLAALPLLGAAEAHQLLVEWNDSREEPGAADLPALIAAQAARTPEAVAVAGAEGELTYRELVARAGRLARHLRRLGVGPEVLVGIALERTPDLVVALLGILAAGGAYLPLDEGYPRERLAQVLADARPAVLVTGGSPAARRLADLPERPPRLLDLDREAEAIGREPGEGLPDGGAAPDNLAYVLFTSGSTGRPKGVEIPRRALVNFLLSMRRAPGFAAGERLLAVTSLSFDIAALEIFLPLLSGGTVELAGREEAADPQALAARMSRAAAASTANWAMQSTPSTWRMLLASGWAGDSRLRAFCGGEALPPDLAAALAPRVFELWNLYGPTETTVWSSRQRLAPGERVTIGRPLAATSLRVLDPAGAPAPLGVSGELLIGGRGVARGYLGRPDLTAESFVPDPFPVEAGARLYRTGDLARTLPDGRIEHLGRRDHQVKVRGFRVETGEVELALTRHPGVAEAAVAARRDLSGNAYLAAWLVPSGPAAPPPGELQAFLSAVLPEFMIPSVFVPLEALPLTANRKLDRQALPAPAHPKGTAVYTPPGTALEEAIAEIWREVLGGTRIGRHDSFFALGGHSLSAAQMVTRVQRSLEVDLPMRAVFEAPTVAALAARVEAARAAGAAGYQLLPPILRADRRQPLPLSPGQRRLWFIDRLEPDSSAYNMAVAVRLSGRLSVAALAAAFARLVERHEVLRTTFRAGADGPVQGIAPATDSFALSVVDLAGLPPTAREPAARRLAAEEAVRPFHLARGPLLRLRLLSASDDEHVLVLTLHHIVADGWSWHVLARELAELYTAARTDRPADLPPLSIQYADFALWQQRFVAGAELARQLAWWREQLAGAPALLALPTDRPRPAVRRPQGARGGTVPVALPAGLVDGLAALGQAVHSTLFMGLLAGFAVLLGRLSGSTDLVVGAPVADRRHRATEGLIGFLVNLLALRIDLSGGLRFADLLGRAREVTLLAYAHQDLPFDTLVEELAPQRSPGALPLVQAVLAFQNAPAATLALPGLAVELLPVGEGGAKFDLTLTLAGGEGHLEYDRDLFDRTTVLRWRDAFARLLASAVATPWADLGELPLLAPAERRQLLDWSGDETAYPRESTVAELFLAQAAQTPDAVAIQAAGAGGETLSYGELASRAERLGALLAALGVGPEVPVGLFLERSPALVVSMLAVLAAGGAYVPLDPGYPAERLALLLDEARVPVLVSTGGLDRRLPAHRARVVQLDGRLPLGRGRAGQGGAGPESLAYVMFTSGSTGRPKGVAVVHRGIVRLVRGTGYARFAPDEVWLQSAPTSFDAATLEIWGALLHGGRLVLMPPGPSSLAELGTAIARHGVTSLWLTAGLFHAMVEEDLAALSPLRQLLAGGEALSPAHAARMIAALPGTRLIDGYGPTEGTTFTCCGRVVAPVGPSVPLGRPIANTRVHVVDGAGRPVPIGMAGELWAGGDGLARGYLGRPERTAERFVPDPFGGRPGERLYRTGDRVRWLPDGRLEFLGRLDRQAKIRGFRVEPGEVEGALLDHPAVAQAAVVAREDRPGTRRLVAYVVLRAGAELPVDLRAGLRARLPEHLVPEAVVLLPELPLNAHGKLDREALPAPPEPAAVAPEGEPLRPVEEIVAAIWCDLLGISRAGRRDNFFELGGHSLLATQLVSRLLSSCGVELPLRRVFEAPTLAELAAHVESLRSLGAEPMTFRRLPRPARLPLSYAQERLWFLYRLDPRSPAFNLAGAVELTGDLDVAALAGSFDGLYARHEALRTCFHEVDGEPWQVIAPAASLGLPLVDLSALALPGAERELGRLAIEERRRPFDLAAGPLLRVQLLRLGTRRHLVLLSLHHIVGDGWSMAVLERELGDLYAALTRGEPSPLPALDLQFADFALWQRRWLAEGEEERQLAYWRRQLRGPLPVLLLPLRRQRPDTPSLLGAVETLHLSRSSTDALHQLSRREGATLFMTLLAAFQALLHDYTGQEDVVVGTNVANRNSTEVEGLIGFFVNNLALRTDLSGNPSFRQLLGRVREVTLDAYAHQDVAFERVIADLQPRRHGGYSPVFQVMLLLENFPIAPRRLPGLELTPRALPSPSGNFELMLSMAEGRDGLIGRLTYDADLFEAATMARLMADFATFLAQAAAQPDATLAGLSLDALPVESAVTSSFNESL